MPIRVRGVVCSAAFVTPPSSMADVAEESVNSASRRLIDFIVVFTLQIQGNRR